MPIKRQGEVRHLLKDGNVRVVKKIFTIQVLYDSTRYPQPIIMVHASASHKKLKLIEPASTLLMERRMAG